MSLRRWSRDCCLSVLMMTSTLTMAAPVEPPAAVVEADAQRSAVIGNVAPAVVAVFGEDGGGSGVLIEASGIAVTNFHVVQGLGPFMKCGLNDGRIYDAVLIGIDPTGDVAVIQLLGREDFPFAPIGDSDRTRVGDEAFCMGNPFLLATDFHPTCTWGMVSGVHRYQFPDGTFLEYTDCLQVDASINPGNSGGPLFNAQGEIIGINGRISVAEARGRVNVGTGYAISMNQVMNFLDHLKSGRIVDHATLGATVSGTADGSVIVSNILESSSAFRRGLRRGDELVSFAGRPVRSVNQFKNVLGIYPKGWTLPLSFRRDGQRFDVRVRLQALHGAAELSLKEDEPEPAPDEKRPPLPKPLQELLKKKPKLPEQYAHLYKERTGYANYHFNEVQQQRLLKLLDAWGDYRATKPGWQLTGTMNGSIPFETRLLPEAITLRLADNYSLQKLSEDFRDLPAGSGGLLVALEQLKHLLRDRQDYFTEMFYEGSEPFGPENRTVDVLITTKVLVTSRWYFERSTGQLLGYDTSLAEDVDPCEIRFEGFSRQGEAQLPQTLVVRHGEKEFGRIAVESLRYFDPPASGGPNP